VDLGLEQVVQGAADRLCPICLDVITEAAYVARCFHRFCSTCIRRWRRQNNTCPLCRQPIERTRYKWDI
uniref:RING-type E3 ubiquitin transferase n=1 Tax=Anser brachyrhynchus TaxID=132585 RepID=A0A8B9BG33_9AVES